MVIILFNTALRRSEVSTVSSEKLAFCLSMLSVFFVLSQSVAWPVRVFFSFTKKRRPNEANL